MKFRILLFSFGVVLITSLAEGVSKVAKSHSSRRHGFFYNVCELPPVEGYCKAYFRRYWYDYKTKSCEKFIYGGCGGNANNFATLEACEEACDEDYYQSAAICEQPQIRGPCKARFIRYWFNSETQRCETFLYGGCQGNRNNFKSYEECRGVCETGSASINDKGDICKLTPDAGPCLNEFARFYYFDSSSGTCKPFDFGGCGGNDNRFTDIASCEAACKK